MTNADIAEAKHLLQSALSCLDSGSPESAIWRLVDAAGLVSQALPAKAKKDLIGLTMATGRGYFLGTR